MSIATQNVPAPYGEPFTNLETRHSQTKAGVGLTPSKSTPATSNTNVHEHLDPTGDAKPQTTGHNDENAGGETQRPQGTTATGAHEAEAAKRETESSDAEQPSPDRGTNKHSLASSGGQQPAEEEDGAAKGEGQGEKPDESLAPEGGYPEQLHAGHLDGVGPEFGKQNRTGFLDRVQGIKEQLKGTVKHDPELKQKGHERMTGELKRKQHEEEPNMDPFGTAADKDKDEDKDEDDGNSKINDDKEIERNEKSEDRPGEEREEKTARGMEGQTQNGTDSAPHAHPTDKGAFEQAASVKSEAQEKGTPDPEKRAKEGGESAQVGSKQ